MTDNKELTDDLTDVVTDGFDLIEYPSAYSFKAMCKTASGGRRPTDIVSESVLLHAVDEDVVGVRSSMSRTGKFESVTITVMVQDRAMLEAIYQSLANCSDVLMTL